MVNVGIIGLGPVWEARYRRALEKLRQRIRVCAVYDAVASRAEQMAAEFHATPVNGVLALVERPDVQAVLLFGSDWHGHVPLKFASAQRKPVYISGGLGEDVHALSQLHQMALSEGLTLMPELAQRYTPATGRLKELMATRLGRATQIVIEAFPPAPLEPAAATDFGPHKDCLIGLFDWCRYIVRTSAVSLETKRVSSSEQKERQDRRILLEFRQPRSGGNRAQAELRIHDRPPQDSADPATSDYPTAESHYKVDCEQGKAILQSPVQISWTTSSELITESLTTERSAVEVTLDQFCRRVVGGLIPVADLADVCHGMTLAQAADQSLRTGRAVTLNGRLEIA